MNAVILACSSLKLYIDAAQKKMKTDYPVVLVDRKYHSAPRKMRRKLIEAMSQLPPEIDTILVAMGFCGGSWNEVPLDKRVVIPRVDDCITLLLHTDDTWHPNLKQVGHFYLRDERTSFMLPETMKRNLCQRYGEKKGTRVFDVWFDSYTDVDIIHTDICDCHSEEYLSEARKNAKLIKSRLNHVKGSTILLEKLVAGKWDEQFLIAEPGQLFSVEEILE